MTADVQEINRKAAELRARLDPLYAEIAKVIVGQRTLIDRLLVGLLTGGHLLLEGVPGLAKTLAVRTLARGLRLSFSRIQFTPDLLPADVIGTQIYNPRTGEFSVKKGPVFAQVVLADEINRAPAKVQSALLEAMQEMQVTIGDASHRLEQPFLVLATQNPIEQEGTYPLPEAQVDRFMLKLKVTYPNKEDELAILDRMAAIEPHILVEPVLGPDDLFALREGLDRTYLDDKIKRYIVDVVHATRRPAEYGLDIGPYIQYPASPRATIFLRAGQGPGAARRPRLRHAAGREDDRPRRAAPPRQRHLRGGGRGGHAGKSAATDLRSPQSAVRERPPMSTPSAELRDLLALHLTPGVGPRTAAALLERFGSAAAVLRASAGQLRDVPHVGPKIAEALLAASASPEINVELEAPPRRRSVFSSRGLPIIPHPSRPFPIRRCCCTYAAR